MLRRIWRCRRSAKHIKKDRKDAMKLASGYSASGISLRRSTSLLGIPRSSFYSRPVQSPAVRGRKTSSFALRINDPGIRLITNSEVVEEIQKTLSMEFVCYGYKKMTVHLRRHGYIVDAKKVRRLMDEASLLNHRYNEHRPVKRVVVARVVVKAPNMAWEFDIKYVHVQGEGRNVFLLCFENFENCYTREIVGFSIGHHCTGSDVSAAIAMAFDERGITEITAVKLRSDNGTQFVCSRVEQLLDLMHIEHERIHPQTSKEDVHIKAFNSILEREVIRRFEFSSFDSRTQSRQLRGSSTSTTQTDCILQSVTRLRERCMLNGRKRIREDRYCP